MVTRVTSEIDWSTFPGSDGEPMAETTANAIQMVDLQFALQTLFDVQGRGAHTAVGGNQLMYYNPRDGRDHVSPDVYVIFDRRPPPPPSWRTWAEGKFPDIVWEITSPSTHTEDVGHKRTLYARLGVREYYIFDPQQETDPLFAGYEVRGDRLEPLPALAGGGIYSPLLGTELRPEALGQTERRPAGMWLRVIDPRSGLPLPTSEEVQHTLQTTQHTLQTTQHDFAALRGDFEQMRRDVAIVQRESEQVRRDVTAMQEHVTREEQARRAAEQRAAQAEQRAAQAEQRAVQAEAVLQAMLDTDAGRSQDTVS